MEHFHIDELTEFSTAKRIRKDVVKSPRIVAELLCYEPGQGTPVHQHPQQDEIFHVIEGRGSMNIDGDEVAVKAGSMLIVPAESRHGVAAASDSRLVMLIYKAPATTVAKSNPNPE